MLQLNLSIPMEVLGKRTGEAFLVIDYSVEHDIIFVVALDKNGEIWAAPNDQCRFIKNWSIGRNLEEK